MSGKYEDIIGLPHHVSETRPRMAMIDRAAQFSPFAALTGYDEAVEETARLTDQKLELDETQKEKNSEQLLFLKENEKSRPDTCVVYFVPDERKAGGAYVTYSGPIKKVDEFEQLLVFLDGIKVPFDDIYCFQNDKGNF